MANIKSQIKRNRQTIVRTERNKAVRSELKTRTKNAITAAFEERTGATIDWLDGLQESGFKIDNQRAVRKVYTERLVRLESLPVYLEPPPQVPALSRASGPP